MSWVVCMSSTVQCTACPAPLAVSPALEIKQTFTVCRSEKKRWANGLDCFKNIKTQFINTNSNDLVQLVLLDLTISISFSNSHSVKLYYLKIRMWNLFFTVCLFITTLEQPGRASVFPATEWILQICFFVFLNPIIVKTAEPIGPKIFVVSISLTTYEGIFLAWMKAYNLFLEIRRRKAPVILVKIKNRF